MIEQQRFQNALQQIDPQVVPANVGQLVSDERFEHVGGHFGQPTCRQQHARPPQPHDQSLAHRARSMHGCPNTDPRRDLHHAAAQLVGQTRLVAPQARSSHGANRQS
jgi:hypothetical protein